MKERGLNYVFHPSRLYFVASSRVRSNTLVSSSLLLISNYVYLIARYRDSLSLIIRPSSSFSRHDTDSSLYIYHQCQQYVNTMSANRSA